MKTYLNEEEFVKNFAKDAKESLRNGNFEAEVNGATIVVTGMDNNNASKVTIVLILILLEDTLGVLSADPLISASWS